MNASRIILALGSRLLCRVLADAMDSVDSSALSIGEQTIFNWLHLRLANRPVFPLAYGLCHLSKPVAREFRGRLLQSDYPLGPQVKYELNHRIQVVLPPQPVDNLHFIQTVHPRVYTTRSKKCGRTTNCSCSACQRLASL